MTSFVPAATVMWGSRLSSRSWAMATVISLGRTVGPCWRVSWGAGVWAALPPQPARIAASNPVVMSPAILRFVIRIFLSSLLPHREVNVGRMTPAHWDFSALSCCCGWPLSRAGEDWPKTKPWGMAPPDLEWASHKAVFYTIYPHFARGCAPFSIRPPPPAWSFPPPPGSAAGKCSP